jgi:hypothetical protein
MAEPTSKRRTENTNKRFSARLESWLEGDGSKTIGALTDLIDEKSFALIIMLLLFPSALPIPTGGVTHVLELIAALVACQMALGRRELWLPRRFRDHELGEAVTGKAVPAIIRRVRWFERWARPRLATLLDTRGARSVLAVFLLVFIAGALFAPPFSGLDTLPSAGVVIMCLGIIFSDVLIVALGVTVGAVGIGLVVALGSAAWSFL